MTRRPRYVELALLVAAVAVLGGKVLGPEAVPSPQSLPAKSKPTNLSIRGVRLGMSRDAVVKLLGEPQTENAYESYPGLVEAKYAVSSVFGDPEVVYDPSGRVVGVSGAALQWNSGRLVVGDSQKSILKYFPAPAAQRPAFYHPYSPGEYVYPREDLVVETDVESMWSSPRVFRVSLQVPFLYPMSSFWQSSDASELLAETGRTSRSQNRTTLGSAEVVGCFFCVAILDQPALIQENLGFGESAVCPTCKWSALLAGDRSEITTAYLQQVHDAWFQPYQTCAAKLTPESASGSGAPAPSPAGN